MPADEKKLNIRPAELADLPRIQSLFEQARRFMRSTGNLEQWKHGEPKEAILRSDIANRQLYVIVHSSSDAPADEVISGVFALVSGKEPTYENIDGQWLREAPYITMHRCASDGSVRGLFDMMVSFAAIYGLDVRIDTHEQNAPMQRAILRNGFRHCGTIHLADGAPRLAYQRIAEVDG